jgi:hypothetical protein
MGAACTLKGSVDVIQTLRSFESKEQWCFQGFFILSPLFIQYKKGYSFDNNIASVSKKTSIAFVVQWVPLCRLVSNGRRRTLPVLFKPRFRTKISFMSSFQWSIASVKRIQLSPRLNLSAPFSGPRILRLPRLVAESWPVSSIFSWQIPSRLFIMLPAGRNY